MSDESDARGARTAPSGTVTLMFTDIVDSCALWESDPEGMKSALQTHIRGAMGFVEAHGGIVFKTVGDAICAAFESPSQAIRTALRIQATSHPRDGIRLEVRVGIHTGTAEVEDGDYVGQTSNRVARLVGLASGGQILVSEAARVVADEQDAFDWHDHGSIPLRGMKKPMRVFQLVHPDLRPPTAGLPILSVPNNLSGDERPFIGRAKERADLRRKLATGERFITITGMGGIGKTSLARQLAVDSMEMHPDGVWFVECETLSTEQDLAAAVAERVGATGTTHEDIAESTTGKRVLVIFDCFENITALAPWLDRLARVSPRLSVIVTSRVVLGVPREFEYALAPLPTAGRAGNESLSLFTEAARHVVDDFSATGRNRAYVRQICESLEGVPLAIVLAAGRLRMLSLAELLDQIRLNRLEVLQRRGPTTDRHRDIQDVIAGSFNLLDDAEQQLLVRLSVFRGGFSLDDARAILSVPRLLAGLTSLRESSLIMASESGSKTRYRILDTVREYLVYLERERDLQELVSADAERHAEWFTQRAEELHHLEASGKWDSFIREFWTELGNLRLAISYADLEGRVDLVGRFTRALLRALLVIGLWEDFDHLAEAGLMAAVDAGDQPLEAWILMSVGTKHRRCGEEDEGRAAYLRRIDLLERLGDIDALADALSDLVEQAVERGHVDDAKADLARLGALVHMHPSPLREGLHVLSSLQLAKALGDRQEVEALIDQIPGLAASIGSSDLLITVLGQGAEFASWAGRTEQAQIWARSTLKLAVQGERVYSAVRALLLIAELAPTPAQAARSLHIAHLVPIDARSQLARRVNEARRASAAIPELPKAEAEFSGLNWIEACQLDLEN